MKKITLLILLCSFYLSVAQQGDTKLSISFENSTAKEVILLIEKQTNFHFYFVDQWLDEGLISGSYEDVTIEELLNSIFNETLINYYISSEKQIILTKNSVIYENLPQGFFKEKNKTISEISKVETTKHAPVFYNEANYRKKAKIETIRIGRENTSTSQFAYLTGIVLDAKTAKPVSGVSLLVKSEKRGSVTNDKGEYKLKLNLGVNLIETRSLAFENLQKRIVIYNDGAYNFAINQSYEGLDEVIIEVKNDENIVEVSTGKTKINVKEIKNIPLVLGERDIFKVALTLPGISSAGEGDAGFNVRGGKTDQNLVLLDDATMYNPSHLFGLFSAVNPFSTGDVTIYKGNIPANYGGRLSSVFDIKTKDASIKKTKRRGFHWSRYK